MFNFSANHLFLLSRTEYRSCAVFLMQDRDTQRVYRLHDFTKAQLISPDITNSTPTSGCRNRRSDRLLSVAPAYASAPNAPPRRTA